MLATARIAVSVWLSGPASVFGQPNLDGATLAAEAANTERGRPRIEPDVHDDGGEPEKASQETHEIGAGDALLVVGPAITPMTLAAGPL